MKKCNRIWPKCLFTMTSWKKVSLSLPLFLLLFSLPTLLCIFSIPFPPYSPFPFLKWENDTFMKLSYLYYWTILLQTLYLSLIQIELIMKYKHWLQFSRTNLSLIFYSYIFHQNNRSITLTNFIPHFCLKEILKGRLRNAYVSFGFPVILWKSAFLT